MKLVCQFLTKKTFLLCLVVFVFQISLMISAEKRSWCWTKSQVNNPAYILNQKNGGFNWGYCASPEISDKTTITYSGFVKTALSPRSTTTSTVLAKLCGTKGCFPSFITLSQTGFDKQGIRQEIKDFENIDIGDPLKLIVRINGSDPYQCSTIYIIKDGVESSFECLRKLYPCSKDPTLCELETIADGNTNYNVSIKTGDEKSDGNLGPVHIILYGDKKISLEKIFSDEAQKYGNIVTSDIHTEDLGEIRGFKLILLGEGKWRPVSITIKNEAGDEKNFEIENTVLRFPGNNVYEVKEKESSVSSSDDNKDMEDDTDFPHMNGSTTSQSLPGIKPSTSHSLDLNDIDGGLINYNEKKNIINLKCDQVLKNTEINLFGPDYPTKKVGYMRVLARCPSNCSELNETVFGVGIHPTSSPICMSALVDKAISPYGGIISISILPGLDQYKLPNNFPKKIGNITIKQYLSADSMKSYSVSKVDGPDFVEKDYRILNDEGKLSNFGRLEVRLGGEWGSVCMKGIDRLSANIICKDLDYKGGKWETKNDTPNTCGKINGKNYCGSILTKIHFSNILCETSDSSLEMCNKNYANREECDHSKDAVINCFNENYENSDQIPDKTVRLDAIKIIKETNEVIGRLEFAKDNKFMPVCNTKFNLASAKISCKAMGFNDGIQITGSDATEFQNNIEADIGFGASEVECDEQSNSLKQCKGKYDAISCSHENDTVVKCKGDGDYSGKSQYEMKPLSPPPELSKLGLVELNIPCSKRGYDIDLRGDPGSIYKICCPAGCVKQPGAIWGIGLYSGDSNVCLAAIHTGVLEENSSGCFILTRVHGNSSYSNLTSNDIESIRSDLKWLTAFTVNETNSGWENMAIKFKRDDPIPKSSSFIETNIESKLNNNQYSSFLQTTLSVPKPLFSFVENNPRHIFSDHDNYLFEGGKLAKVNEFTVFFKFIMKQFTTTSVLFSYRGEDGFNIYVNQNGELYIGSLTNSKNSSSLDIIVPLNTKVSCFVVFKEGQLSYSIIIKNGPKHSNSGISSSLFMPIVGQVGIGRLALINKNQFTGSIDFIEIYGEALDPSIIPLLIKEIKHRKNTNVLKKEYTVDRRECVSPCMTTTPKTGNPPKEAEINADLKIDIDLTDNTNGETNNDNDNLLFGDDEIIETPIENKKDEKNPGGVVSPDNYVTPPYPGENGKNVISKSTVEPFYADEDTTLDDPKFKYVKVPKNFFRVSCPRTDPLSYYPIYGFAIYRSDSSICRAALHFGKLLPYTQGDIIIRVEGSHQAYNGGMGFYDIQSEDILETENHLSFTIEKADNFKVISCEEDLRSSNFLSAGLSQIIIVQCPKDCDKVNREIFGGNISEEKCTQAKDNSASNCIYSEDSPICKSAIHCGVINSTGGYVEVKVEGEQARFIAASSFGIISKEKASQVRSYSFAGERSAIFANFQENYEGSILNNWAIITNPNSKNRIKNNWTFFENNNNFFNSDGKKEEIRAIKHTGIVSVNLPFTASTILKKKDLEFANGLIKFNLMINEVDPIYFYLRFIDEDNFIALLINNRDNMNNYSLLLKVQGSIKILDSKNIPMELKKWYRFEAYLYSDSVRILVQDSLARRHKEIFSKKVSQISRGTIAFGTNGNNFFYLSGISVEPFSLKAVKRSDESNVYTFEYIKKKSNNHEVKIWCTKTFKYSLDDYNRCLLPQFFCRHKCQVRLPPEEYGILNLKCVNECINSMKKAQENNGIVQVHEEEAPRSYHATERVDFMILGEKNYIPAIVKSISNKEKETYLTIEYQDSLGNVSTDEVVSNSDRIKKCGNVLKKRSDCL